MTREMALRVLYTVDVGHQKVEDVLNETLAINKVKKRLGVSLAICMLAGTLACGPTASAQTDNSKNSSVPEQPPTPKALSKSDSTQVSHIPGSYLHFNGFSGRLLRLLPDENYQLTYFQDTILKDDPTGEGRKSFGKWVTNQDGSLTITPLDGKRKRRYLSVPITLWPVHWGERLYLISDKEFIKFRDAIAAGTEPHGRFRNPPFLLREGDEKKPAPGLPEFPPRWQYLLDGVKRPSPPTQSKS